MFTKGAQVSCVFPRFRHMLGNHRIEKSYSHVSDTRLGTHGIEKRCIVGEQLIWIAEMCKVFLKQVCMNGYLEYASISTNQFCSRKVMAWSTWTLLYGFSGRIQGWLASLDKLFCYSAHAEQLRTSRSMSSSMCGQETTVRAGCFIPCILKCLRCISSSIRFCWRYGIMICEARKRHQFSVVNKSVSFLK